MDSPFTLLNVLGANIQKGRFLADSLNCGRRDVQYYRDNDLAIGGVINVFGRRVILTECDKFTQEYYRVKYGLGEFFLSVFFTALLCNQKLGFVVAILTLM